MIFQVQAVTEVGGGSFSIPVRVTVVIEEPTTQEPTTQDVSNTTATPQVANSDNNNLFALAVLPSMILVLIAIAIFSLLYYRRYTNTLFVSKDYTLLLLCSGIEREK